MKKILALALSLTLALSLCACGGDTTGDTAENTDTQQMETDVVEIPEVEDLTSTDTSTIPGVEDGVLTVGMECAYAPYNWTQNDDSNGAVPIVNNPGSYANGYDVMIAQRICDTYGWELEIMSLDWAGLIPALQAGTIDAVIAGQSMTEDRMAEVDMAGPYFYASIVCVTKEGSDVASATGISQLTGTCTAQTGTIWYDTCLPQAAEVADIEIMPQTEDAPAMIMAVESGTVNFICTDIPTAMGACARYDDLTILDFSDNAEDNFDVSEGDINIGISVVKGNTQLKDAIDTVLAPLNGDIFNAIMNEAIAVQPTI
jgi:putative lysine transport system substrate-binding protein